MDHHFQPTTATFAMTTPRVFKVWLSGFVSLLVGIPPGTEPPDSGDEFADPGLTHATCKEPACVEFAEECPPPFVEEGLRKGILSGVFLYERREDKKWVSTGEALSKQ